jgi:GNAT superfamily N-acetyltransferase
MSPRIFVRERDLDALLGLVARLRAGARGSHFLHPGGLQWLLRKVVDPDFAVHVWYDADELVAFIVEDGSYAIPHADPERVDMVQVLGWAEGHARSAGRAELEISVWDEDTRLRAEIDRRGYAPAGTLWPELVYDVSGEPAAPSLPEGFRFVPFSAEMDDAYIEMHRDAWSTIKPSPYRRQLHDIVTSMPFFDRDLVPIVAAPDGTLAAYCIGWYDPTTAWTEIEPLGTRPAFRAIGLAHAVVREAIHRSWQRGARAVMVWGSSKNDPAMRLYTSSGMTARRISRDYRKAL